MQQLQFQITAALFFTGFEFGHAIITLQSAFESNLSVGPDVTLKQQELTRTNTKLMSR